MAAEQQQNNSLALAQVTETEERKTSQSSVGLKTTATSGYTLKVCTNSASCTVVVSNMLHCKQGINTFNVNNDITLTSRVLDYCLGSP